MSEPGEHVQEESFPSDVEFDDDEEADSESSSDVDAKLAEEDVFDIEFFKCYSALKKKDDKIYDKNVKFFNEDDEDKSSEDEQEASLKDDSGGSKKLRKQGPKMTLLDHQLNLIDEEDQVEEAKVDLNKEVSKSYYEKELEEIKKSIEEVGKNIDSDDDEDLLIVKSSKNEAGPSKPKKRIQEMLDKLEEQEDEDLNHLKQIWTDPDKLTKDDKFLRDYIVNKLYLQQNDDAEDDDAGHKGFFSKNLDDLSDAEDDSEKDDKEKKKKHKVELHSEEKNFDKLTRIPRNSTKTIRDLVEKREKKEKRMKTLEKEKKRKKALKEADFEDLIGDLPTKFHYRETEPNDYGLSAEELLMATDEELEKWCRLKDTIAYKSVEEELRDKERFDRKRDDLELKRNIFKSIYDPDASAEPEGEPDSQLVSKKNKRIKRKHTDEVPEATEEETSKETNGKAEGEEQQGDGEETLKKRKKKHKRGVNHKKFAKTGVAPDRLLAYGLSKNKLKKSNLL